MTIDELMQSPHEQDVFQAIYLLERSAELDEQENYSNASVLLGHDGPFDSEAIKFKVDPSLGFNGISINKVVRETTNKDSKTRWSLTLACMGLVGANGVLPQHYTELVQQRVKAKDFALLDFIDMFNHRIISLYFRAWQKYRVALHHGRALAIGQRDTFSVCVDSLSGNHQQNPSVSYYAGLFSNPIKSSVNLQQMLADYLQVNVEVKQFVGTWLKLDSHEQTRFDKNNKALACLGQGAMLGQQYWSVQNNITIVIGPIDYALYAELLPRQGLHRSINTLIKQFVDSSVSVSLSLLMNESGKKKSQLNKDTTRLGESSWLGSEQVNPDQVSSSINFVL